MINIVSKTIGKFIFNNDWFTTRLIRYKSSSIRIIYYHMISDSSNSFYFSNKGISRKIFEEHIKFFQKHFVFVNFFEAFDSSNRKYKNKKPIIITFDDGFKENMKSVLPVLKKYNISATFFISTNFIDNKDLMWRNKLVLINNKNQKLVSNSINIVTEEFNLNKIKKNEDLFKWSINNWPMENKEKIINLLWSKVMEYPVDEYLALNKPYLTIDDIKFLNKSGHTIGSHSMSHPVFSNLKFDQFKHEIFKSSKILSDIIQRKVTLFSYPFGLPSSIVYEERYKDNLDPNIKFFGIKNNLSNDFSKLRFQRDNTEFEFEVMLSRFLFLPIIRKFLY